jgi:ribosome recycling factor
LAAAKAKKGRVPKGGSSEDDDNDNNMEGKPPVKLPDMKELDGAMERKITRLADEFSKLRSGQVSAEIFKNVMVDCHGSRVSVSEAAQVSLKGPSKLTVSVYDPTLVSAVSNAIRDCGMNLNPTTEGNAILVTMPKPSKETRDAVLKTASKAAEKAKQDVRQIRKDGMDVLKKAKSAVSEDDTRRFSKEIETLTEKKLEKVGKLLKDKEKDILAS